jgi:hypothetical protein
MKSKDIEAIIGQTRIIQPPNSTWKPPTIGRILGVGYDAGNGWTRYEPRKRPGARGILVEVPDTGFHIPADERNARSLDGRTRKEVVPPAHVLAVDPDTFWAELDAQTERQRAQMDADKRYIQDLDDAMEPIVVALAGLDIVASPQGYNSRLTIYLDADKARTLADIIARGLAAQS